MKKILLGVVIAGIILALFFVARPFAAGLLDLSAPPETDLNEDKIIIEPKPDLSIVQGGSDEAFRITNQANVTVTHSLGHAHAYLALEPREYTLAPGASRTITIHVDDFCPSGETEFMVYLLADADDESFGMETIDIIFDVLPGELTLDDQDGRIAILWNNGPPPPGIGLYYNNPDNRAEVWQKWGETPRVSLEIPPSSIDPGRYNLDFIARLGSVESEVKSFEVTVEALYEPPVYITEEPEEEPEFDEVDGMRYRIDYGDTEMPREPATLQIPPQEDDSDRGIRPF